MKDSLCAFNIRGETLMESKYLRVYRQKSMLVVVFLNLLIMPLYVKPIGFGHYDLCIQDTPVFRVRKENERIVIVVEGIESTGLRFGFWVGTSNAVRCSIVAGYKIAVDEHLFLQSEVYSWAKAHGVVHPVGCARTVNNAILEWGCWIDKPDYGLVVRFPNDMKFIIPIGDDYVRIVCEDVKCEYPKESLIVVTVDEMSEMSVTFRVLVWYGGVITTFEGIVYDNSGVHYGDDYVSARQITKQLVLGGMAV